MTQNAIPPTDVASRIAGRTLAKRGADYADEVRRLLDAALEVMRECGTVSRPRVADVVAAAGLSNEAFYRHFPSKDALVDAILEDGTTRLVSYLAHHMAKETTPEGKVRRWVEGVLSQTDEEVHRWERCCTSRSQHSAARIPSSRRRWRPMPRSARYRTTCGSRRDRPGRRSTPSPRSAWGPSLPGDPADPPEGTARGGVG